MFEKFLHRFASTVFLFCTTMTLLLCGTVALAEAFKLPDTGQTTCYQTVSPYAEILCAGAGQDGSYDISPMSYTDNGDGTVTDNNTGLIWQKQDDGNGYNWYQAVGAWDPFKNPSSKSVCGELGSGWRLPTKKELITIVDYSVPYSGPTINPIFTNTKQSYYWSSTSNSPVDQSRAWNVYFSAGFVNVSDSNSLNYVRCVHGGELDFGNFIDNHDGTITDNDTGLTWQQAAAQSMTWQAALDYCEGSNLAGKSDWRLPNIKELASLTNDSKNDPAIDTNYFPVGTNYFPENEFASDYWSSTTFADNPDNAWGVYFYDGMVSTAIYGDKSYDGYSVRCVRGGESGSLNSFVLSVSKTGAGSGTVTSSPSGINCVADCSEMYTSGTIIVLTAMPASGSTFSGWAGGGCSGTGSCTITLNADTTVYAGFYNNCAATLSDDFLNIHVPIAVYGSKYYSADMQSGNGVGFLVTGKIQLTDTSAYTGCLSAAPLVSSVSIHMPVLIFEGQSYWADFARTGNMTFTMTNAGGN